MSPRAGPDILENRQSSCSELSSLEHYTACQLSSPGCHVYFYGVLNSHGVCINIVDALAKSQTTCFRNTSQRVLLVSGVWTEFTDSAHKMEK